MVRSGTVCDPHYAVWVDCQRGVSVRDPYWAGRLLKNDATRAVAAAWERGGCSHSGRDDLTPITLSKSRFAVALECPRQLDYARDSAYYDSRKDDEFLASLAAGGHQVGELARRMFADGHLIGDEPVDEQAKRTGNFLARSEVTLFEATVRHENLLIRADILKKKGNRVSLIEVKAKGFNPEHVRFLTERGTEPVLAAWRPYLYDVAYQAYVLKAAYPHFEITPYLMLLDKTVTVKFDGLNSMLAVNAVGRKVTVTGSNDFDVSKLDPPILKRIDVSDEVDKLLAFPLQVQGPALSFEEFVDWASGILGKGESFPVTVGAQCKGCHHYLDPDDVAADKKSGWAQCMQEHTGAQVLARRSDTVFGLYKLSPGRLNDLVANEPLLLAEVSESALGDKLATDEITLDQRQRLQLAEAQGDIEEPFVLHGALRRTFDKWKWPLHFLDFETSRPALPYHRGRTPHDQILFQFSHHVMDAQGRVEHRTQCLQAEPGVAPSVPVLRALRDALAGDDGSVVHWWTHEASVLKAIRAQIVLDKPDDAETLVAFVDSLVGGNKTPGRLQDLGVLVSKTVFYPGTGGSSSIKKVLPAALRHSSALRDRYRAPIYGTTEMPSLNVKDWVWVKIQDDAVQDPYMQLDPLFDNSALQKAISIAEEGGTEEAKQFIANGGAAIIAYDQLQQPGLPAGERVRITRQLLRYCELDTLAMVMIYQSLTGRGL